MSHKTLIGGTAYEISGGKTLVNGTAYSIDKGKTLVGGTAYEVGFGGFDVIIDLGNVTIKKMIPTMSTCFTTISLGELPSGYDTLTHAIVDGVMYELTLADTTAGYLYTLPNDSVFQVTINTSAKSAIVVSYKEGTYNIQLGILS